MNIGVLAAGQLGRMLALEGYDLGLQFRFLEPKLEAPATILAPSIQAEYTDFDALDQFADGLDVVTYEFENVPVHSAEYLAKRLPFFPPPQALRISQDRYYEKSLFEELSIPTAPFRRADSAQDIQNAVQEIGLPLLLKTIQMGYDGKGQYRLQSQNEAGYAWQLLGEMPVICEEVIPFDRELSIVSVRSRNGEMAFYPLVENHHRDGILHKTIAPAANVTPEMQAMAESYARKVLQRFDYVGVLTIELFEKHGQLLANEMASRVHNSGHWTLDGAVTSQFENHIRAILGWPLGPTTPRGHSMMINLIGATPATESIIQIPGAHLHLYNKSPRPGRKLGHVNLNALHPNDLAEAETRLLERMHEASHSPSAS